MPSGGPAADGDPVRRHGSQGQELDDHYFGTIRTRVSSFMQDLDEQLWRLGVLSKTKHNEVDP